MFPSIHSEKLFMQMADHLAADGFKDVGYQFINIDVSEILRVFYVSHMTSRDGTECPIGL